MSIEISATYKEYDVIVHITDFDFCPGWAMRHPTFNDPGAPAELVEASATEGYVTLDVSDESVEEEQRLNALFAENRAFAELVKDPEFQDRAFAAICQYQAELDEAEEIARYGY